MIERRPITSHEEWLAWRRQDVTASRAAALIGAHEFCSPLQLYAEKAGLAKPADETPAMRRGRLLEPVAVQVLREMRPRWQIVPPAIYLRDPETRLGATPDLLCHNEDGRLGIVQIKTAEPTVFAKKWVDPETGEIEVPPWIAIQTLVECALADAEWCAVAVLRVGFGIELDLVPVPPAPALMNHLAEASARFWQSVERREPPAPDFASDADLLLALHGIDRGHTIDLSGNNVLPALADEDAALADEIKLRTERRRAIKAELLHAMGDAAAATMHGQLFATAKTVRRREYMVKATTYRDVRFRRAG